MGKCVDEIATEYELSLSDVYAALAYYFEHRAEIDQSMEENEAFVEELRPAEHLRSCWKNFNSGRRTEKTAFYPDQHVSETVVNWLR